MSSVLLFLAVVLSFLPFGVLFDLSWFFPFSAVLTFAALLVGKVLRLVIKTSGFNTLVHLLLQILTFSYLSWHLSNSLSGAKFQIIKIPTWQSGIEILDNSLVNLLLILDQALSSITFSVPPLAYYPALMLLIGSAMALFILMLDTLFNDLNNRPITAICLMAIALVPSLHIGNNLQPWHFIAPLTATLLVLYQPRKPSLKNNSASSLMLGAVLVLSASFASIYAPLLSFGIKPLAPINLATLNSIPNLGFRGSAPNALMVNEYISMRQYLNEQEPRVILRYEDQLGTANNDYLRLRVLTEFDGVNFVEPPAAQLAAAKNAPAAPSDIRLDEEAENANRAIKVEVNSLISDRLPHFSALRSLHGSPDFSPEARPKSLGEVAMRLGYQDLSGISYQFTAQVPSFEAADLNAVSSAEVVEKTDLINISLEQIPPQITELAEEILADQTVKNPYQSALAFQKYLRGFDYSLTEVTPLGVDPLDYFLTERIGYCEQFAAVFALLMQSQGYPTRVVLGFNAGQLNNGKYEVLNTNAHAWPEVWFGQEYGWVRFEPTPAQAGAGVNLPPSYALTDQAQVTDNSAPSADDIAEEQAPAAPQTTAPQTPVPQTQNDDEPSTQSAPSAKPDDSTANKANPQPNPSAAGLEDRALNTFLTSSLWLSSLLILAIIAWLSWRQIVKLSSWNAFAARFKNLLTQLTWQQAIMLAFENENAEAAAAAAWQELVAIGNSLGISFVAGELQEDYFDRLISSAPWLEAKLQPFKAALNASLYENQQLSKLEAVQKTLTFKALIEDLRASVGLKTSA